MSLVVIPTACTTRVMVPFFASKSAMVRGMRSPPFSVPDDREMTGARGLGQIRRLDVPEVRDGRKPVP